MNIEWKQQEDQSYKGTDENGNTYRQPANQETTTVFMKDGRTGQGWTPEQSLRDANSKTLITSENHHTVLMKHGPRNLDLSIINFIETKRQRDTNEGVVRFYCTQFPDVWKLQIRAFQPLGKEHSFHKGLKPRNLIASVSITLQELEDILKKARASLKEI